MMISNQFILFLTCWSFGANAQKNFLDLSSSVIHQKGGFLSVSTGEAVTLECSYKSVDLTWIFWYKQILGRRPEPISSFYTYSSVLTFIHQFNNNPHFSLDTKNQSHHLKISDLQLSDSATYYCAARYGTIVEFTEGVVVSVKGPGVTIKASVVQSSSKNIHAGDSVTLNCTVHTGSCDGEHRVYWFKDSGDSHPGLIYTHGGRNDQCERKNNTQTHSCVYELNMENLTESHSGNYYCAVASCGHILFGKGAELDLTDSAAPLNSVILHTLVGLLTIMSVIVVFLLWKFNKSNNCTSTEERSPAAPLGSTEAESKDTESLHYAAINTKRSNRSRRQKNNLNTDCVYASVK